MAFMARGKDVQIPYRGGIPSHLEELFHGPPQERQVLLGHRPDTFKVDAHVVVDQYVAQTGHLAPGNVGRALEHLRRKPLRRLANDLELTDHGVMPQGFGHELVMTYLHVALDLLDGVQDMPQVQRVPAHSGVASARTCSRM